MANPNVFMPNGDFKVIQIESYIHVHLLLNLLNLLGKKDKILFVCFVAIRLKSTAMVMAGQSGKMLGKPCIL